VRTGYTERSESRWNLRRAGAHGFALAAIAGLAGCGGFGDPPPGWGDHLHTDITIAGSAPSGGELAIAFDFDEPIEVEFSQCFGGTGAECEGGVLLYAAEDPGFALLVLDDADESLFVLPDGIEIELELMSADAEATLFVEGTTLSAPGDRVVLGTTPEVHLHGSWQLAIPASAEPQASYAFTFRLLSDDGIDPSAEYVALLSPHDD